MNATDWIIDMRKNASDWIIDLRKNASDWIIDLHKNCIFVQMREFSFSAWYIRGIIVTYTESLS